MTRQAFLAQMPDPLSLRLSSSSLSLSPCRSTSRVFSFSPLAPSFLLFLSPFTVVPSLRCVCLFPSDDSLSYFLSFSLFSFSFSPASEVSRDRVGWSLYSYRLSWSHIAERRAHVLPCSGPSRQTNRKQTFMPLYLKRETFTHRG